MLNRKLLAPPLIAAWIIERMLNLNMRYSAMGDFEERFHTIAKERGLLRARLFYWIQICILLPSFINNLIYWSLEMIKNYLKITTRIIKRHKVYSLINILGLAIGMASCLLILLYVQNELSYDRYNEKADSIYRVTTSVRMGERKMDIVGASGPMAKALIDEFPEVEDAVRFRSYGDLKLKHENIIFREDRVIFSEPSFFNIFTIPLLKGDSKTALESPYTLVMSQETAKKYFRDDNPIGKTININDRDDYIVTGVFEEIPDNSHFHFDIILSLSSLDESKNPSWLTLNFPTYLLLREDADPKGLEAKFPMLIRKYMAPQIQKVMGKSLDEFYAEMGMKTEFFVQSLKDIHLHSDLRGEFEPNSDIKYIYIFSAIAIFILIIASINFMNLSTARSSERAKEVGLRKVMGSYRKDLIKQFLTESMILSILSLAVAFLLVWFALPVFNNLSGKELGKSNLGNWFIIEALVVITLLTGILAGSYPAFFISAFQPANVLKGQVKTGVKTGPLRRGLVVFQFTVSIILITGTFVIFNQLQYIQNRRLGFNKDQVLILNNASLLRNQTETFKNEMLKHPYVISATVTGYLPVPSSRMYVPVVPEGESLSKKTPPISIWPVDYDYIKTLEMKIIEGRDFSREFAADKTAAIINQKAVQHFGWDSPLGKRLRKITSPKGDYTTHTVIGVVEDFHFESLRDSIKPLVLYLGRSNGLISFRIKTEDISGIIALLKKKWKEFLPDEPFEYSFLDERFSNIYRSEQRIGKVFGGFAGLAIFIGCLGLFGLAAFTAERRTKEIGIRKVLGASVPGIIRLLIKEFMILVGIANLIAWPIAYFVMNRWLQDFAYRASLGIFIFLFIGMSTLLIALLTVSFQALKAALTDPVKSLRYE